MDDLWSGDDDKLDVSNSEYICDMNAQSEMSNGCAENKIAGLVGFMDFVPGDASTIKGLCGLKNLGNTCFMAAGLQSLMSTSTLVGCFFSYMSDDQFQLDSSTVTGQFALLMKQVWSGDYEAISPRKFKEVLGLSHPQFKDFQQHDCQEFIALVLDSLHEFLNSCKYPFNFQACCKETRVMLQNWSLMSHKSILAFRLGEAGCNSEKSRITLKLKELEDVSHNCSMDNCDKKNNESPANFSSCLQDSNSEAQTPNYLSNQSKDESSSDTLPNSHSNSSIGEHCAQNNFITISSGRVEGHQLIFEEDNIQSSGCVKNAIDLDDIFKEAKTPNVNLLRKEEMANNMLQFDSGKFSKQDGYNRQERSRCTMDPVDTNCVKSMTDIEVSSIYTESSDYLDDIKHNNISKVSVWNNIKRIRLDQDEKNVVFEKQKKICCKTTISKRLDSSLLDGLNVLRLKHSSDVTETVTAERQWHDYLDNNRSVVVDTFQGQFKSTVICSVCLYVSVTYEPFMYLSVPIPHATERQIGVTLVCPGQKHPTQYLITLHKQDKVKKVKQAICRASGLDVSSSVIIAEVLDCHIAKLLDENMLIKYMNDVSRSIYAFSVFEPIELVRDEDSQEIAANGTQDDPLKTKMDDCEKESVPTNHSTWRTCAICLEEMFDLELRVHPSCGCILCSNCIEMSCNHYGGMLICPVCACYVDHNSDFVDLTQVEELKPELRILKIPVVFRHDTLGDGDNNKRSIKLFGHPILMQLPSELNASVLYDTFDQLMSHLPEYKLLLVDGQGYHCSRCIFTAHCKGCEIKRNAVVMLQAGDNIAVRYRDLSASQNQSTSYCEQHVSMEDKRHFDTLTIYDCMRAFSENETLDSNNPWFCPKCKMNQCATKTLTVWRYPDVLIVYLKRFVFYEYTSLKIDNKVLFPVENLNVAPFSHGPLQDTDCLYDLYACVCHFGGVNAGHYTAYIKQLITHEWYYCNDDSIKKQEPQEEDYSHAYILFYQRTSTLNDIFQNPIPSFTYDSNSNIATSNAAT